MKTIKIVIDPKGNSTIDLNGYQGEGCSAVVDSFGAGDGCLQKTPKPEFFQQEDTESEKAVL